MTMMIIIIIYNYYSISWLSHYYCLLYYVQQYTYLCRYLYNVYYVHTRTNTRILSSAAVYESMVSSLQRTERCCDFFLLLSFDCHTRVTSTGRHDIIMIGKRRRRDVWDGHLETKLVQVITVGNNRVLIMNTFSLEMFVINWKNVEISVLCVIVLL